VLIAPPIYVLTTRGNLSAIENASQESSALINQRRSYKTGLSKATNSIKKDSRERQRHHTFDHPFQSSYKWRQETHIRAIKETGIYK
jgi:hypothetical protein